MGWLVRPILLVHSQHVLTHKEVLVGQQRLVEQSLDLWLGTSLVQQRWNVTEDFQRLACRVTVCWLSALLGELVRQQLLLQDVLLSQTQPGSFSRD